MLVRLARLSPLLLLVACDGGINVSGSHSHGDSVSGIREGVWPPEPLNMENEQAVPSGVRSRARSSVLEAARRSVMNNAELLDALGDRYGIFEGTLAGSKSDAVASFPFYNYDTNESIEAVLGGDGGVTVRTQAASEWQPTENAGEVMQAVSLARASLEASGLPVNTLNGTAMLTYPPADGSVAAPPMFHDSRLLYVTFGAGDGEPPLYSARVDLGSGTVSEGGPLR